MPAAIQYTLPTSPAPRLVAAPPLGWNACENPKERYGLISLTSTSCRRYVASVFQSGVAIRQKFKALIRYVPDVMPSLPPEAA